MYGDHDSCERVCHCDIPYRAHANTDLDEHEVGCHKHVPGRARGLHRQSKSLRQRQAFGWPSTDGIGLVSNDRAPPDEYVAARSPNINAALRLFRKDDRITYLVVGSAASQALNGTRGLSDVDVWLAKTAQIGICLEVLGVAHGIRVNGDASIPIGTPPTRLHLLSDIDGVEFEEAYANRQMTADGFPALHRNDIIKSKLASGRPKDLADLRWLRPPPFVPV